jgi:hypothetical protein
VILKDTLKRMLGISQAPAQAEQLKEEVVNMTDVTHADAAADANVAALQSTVASLTEQLGVKDAKIAELAALVAAATEFKVAQEKAAAEAITASRVEKLTALVGTEQAANLQAATASMDAPAFDALVAAMSFKQTAEAASPAFKEVGAEGTTDQTKLNAEVYGGKTADYLQAIVNKELN